MLTLKTLEDMVAEWRDAAIRSGKLTGLPQPLDAQVWMGESVDEPDPILNHLLDRETKGALIGGSKGKKTFGAMQLAVSLAAGLPKFLLWDIPKPRRVLYLNCEVTPAHFHRRLKRVLNGLGLTREQLADRLKVINARGVSVDRASLDELAKYCREVGVELVIIDPLYKLIEGDENNARDVKQVLASIDRLVTTGKCAVLYLHHTAKGRSGDRELIDRAVGSGVVARDYDALIQLEPHQTDGLFVIECIARAYKSAEPATLDWGETRFCFRVRDDIFPAVRTSRNSSRPGRSMLSRAQLEEIFSGRALSSAELDAALQMACGTQMAARVAKKQLLDSATIVSEREKAFHGRTLFRLATPAVLSGHTSP